jgi:hypothetical protein
VAPETITINYVIEKRKNAVHVIPEWEKEKHRLARNCDCIPDVREHNKKPLFVHGPMRMRGL